VGLINETFQKTDAPSALLVYVGDRAAWKTSDNVFRKEPWGISSVPTIVRLRAGVEDSRLVDEEISDKLVSWAKSA